MTDAKTRQKIIEQLTRKRDKLVAELEQIDPESRRAEDIRYDLEEIDEQLGGSPGAGGGDPLVAMFQELGRKIATIQSTLEQAADRYTLSEYEQERLTENAQRMMRERFLLAQKIEKALGEGTPPEVLAVIGERGVPDAAEQTKAAREAFQSALRRLEENDLQLIEQKKVADRLDQEMNAERDWDLVSRVSREALSVRWGNAQSAVEYIQSKINAELGTIQTLRRALRAAGVEAELTAEMEERLRKFKP